jgi:hypothetical protein
MIAYDARAKVHVSNLDAIKGDRAGCWCATERRLKSQDFLEIAD